MATYNEVSKVKLFQSRVISSPFPPFKLHLTPFAFQDLKNKILIQSSVVPTTYYVGPMGDTNPSDFIIKETNQLPFKASLVDASSWTKNTFRNWPNMPAGWRNWYLRIVNHKGADWETHKLSQCLNLSLCQIEKNEPLLIAACYFWSNSINAFIFGHGPMSMTLADVHMLTGL